MTVRDLYDAALIEINKLEAPSMLLEDYNYFINKAIHQYINKVYNRYEINQQATDDLGALKVSKSLNVDFKKTTITDKNGKSEEVSSSPIFPGEDKEYFCTLPDDYWHILSCTVSFRKQSNTLGCNSNNNILTTVARKLTSDITPTIINNAYFKPSYKNPYYAVLTTPVINDLDIIINPCDTDPSSYGYELNIVCGKTDKYEPNTVYINYLKTPETIFIQEEDLDGPDNTKTLEFPEYVCYEIINEFVKLLLENASDPRLQTNIPINQTIIPPVAE